MSSITYGERWTHPTTADVMARLDCEHCDFCEGMATGPQAWWTDPNTVQGREQLDAIGTHVLAQYSRPCDCRYTCDGPARCECDCHLTERGAQ